MSRPFTVAVDARTVFDETRRGIGKTVVELYRALSKSRPAWHFRLFCRTAGGDNPFADCPNVSAEPIDIPGDRFDLWPRLRLPLAVSLARPDVYHAPAGPAPALVRSRLATTIHDLIPIDTGRADPAARVWGASVRHTARRARVVFALSQHARGRITTLLSVPADRIRVVHWGPISTPAAPLSPERLAQLLTQYGVPAGARYVLHFGMTDPRKNTAHLLAEWGKIPEAVRTGVRLVVVGVQGPKWQEFTATAAAMSGAGVGITGYVPEEDARDLLAGAAALAYPTTYEGFGLPLLDAFAAGVPAVAGDRTSVPEVAGDAAELVDPVTPGAVAAGLTRVLTDPAHATELVRRGRLRAAGFTWAKAAGVVADGLQFAAGR